MNTYDSIFCLARGAAGGRTSCEVHHKMIFSWPQHISGVLYRRSDFSSLNFLQSKRGDAVFPCSTYLVPVDWRPLVRVCLRNTVKWNNETMRTLNGVACGSAKHVPVSCNKSSTTVQNEDSRGRHKRMTKHLVQRLDTRLFINSRIFWTKPNTKTLALWNVPPNSKICFISDKLPLSNSHWSNAQVFTVSWLSCTRMQHNTPQSLSNTTAAQQTLILKETRARFYRKRLVSFHDSIHLLRTLWEKNWTPRLAVAWGHAVLLLHQVGRRDLKHFANRETSFSSALPDMLDRPYKNLYVGMKQYSLLKVRNVRRKPTFFHFCQGQRW